MAGPKVKNLAAQGEEKPRLIPVSVAAYPDELERWKRKAAADNRPLSNWLRTRLLQADARDEQEATRFVNSPATASDERQ
jgi:hypothetical protein